LAPAGTVHIKCAQANEGLPWACLLDDGATIPQSAALHMCTDI
jgi:hypothetical protein